MKGYWLILGTEMTDHAAPTGSCAPTPLPP